MSAVSTDVAIGTGARALWQDDLLLDYTIEVEDEQFKVHRVVMASVSDYFRVMLTGGMKESQTDRVKLDRFSASVVSNIIQFIYTGQFGERSVDSLNELLDCAVYLQVPTAIEKCTHDLCEKVDKNNCLDILAVFKLYTLEKGITHTTQYIKTHSKEVAEAYQSVKISYKAIVNLIDFWPSLEWNLFVVLYKWIRADYGNRKEHVDYLMDRIRFNLMSSTELVSIKEMDIFTESEGQWCDLVEQALSCHDLPTHQKRVDEAKSTCDPTLVCFDKSLNSLYALRNGNSWQKYKNLQETWRFEIDPKAAIMVNNTIICYENWRFRWHIYDCRTLTWTEMISSNYQPHRIFFALEHHDKHLYVMGGMTDGGTGTLPDTIQKYDIEANRWQVIDSRLPMAIIGPSAFSIAGSIYMLGGSLTPESTFHLSKVDCFDPTSGAWESKANMLGPIRSKQNTASRTSRNSHHSS